MTAVQQVNFIEHNLPADMPGHNPDTHPDIKIGTVSNLWIKMMYFKKAGDFIPGHVHLFDHTSLLSRGSVEVTVNGETTKFVAPAIIYIQRENIHKITALEDATVVSCVHALRDGAGVEDIISEDMIPRGINPLGIITDFNLTKLAMPRN